MLTIDILRHEARGRGVKSPTPDGRRTRLLSCGQGDRGQHDPMSRQSREHARARDPDKGPGRLVPRARKNQQTEEGLKI